MSLNFKSTRLQKDEVPKTGDLAAMPEKSVENYNAPGTVRTISFAQINGDETVLNYSELRKMEFSQAENFIILTFFGGESVTLTGHNLAPLFESLRTHIPKKIRCLDERYRATGSEADAYIVEIRFEKEEKQ